MFIAGYRKLQDYHMFLSAKAFFKDNSASQKILIKQAETQIPQEFVRIFKKNVVSLTPKDTGALRRSIITQAMGNRAQIGWRSRYARIQNQPEDYGVSYENYTTPGTGPHFAEKAFRSTRAEMALVLRQLGLSK